jgi:CBS domain-containing protein
MTIQSMRNQMADNQTQHEQSQQTGGEQSRDRGRGGTSAEARNVRAAARAGAEAGSDTIRHGARAAEETAHQSGEAFRRSGEAAAETTERGTEAGAEFLNRAAASGGATARRSGRMIAATQRELADQAARQFEEVGQKMAEAAQESAEHLRSLMVLPNPLGSGLRDIQQAASSMVEGVVRTNLRAAQEFFRLSNPGRVIDLQRRFARDYLSALLDGSAIFVQAVRQSAEETLRPIEQQIEHRRSERYENGDQQNYGRRGQSRTVAEVMSTDVRIARPDDTVQQAARLMREEDTGVLPVGEGDRLVGLVTDRDVAVRLVAEGKDPAHTKVREVMTPEVRYVFDDEEIEHVADNMAEQQVRRLPVVNREKRLVGLVSLSDISGKGHHHLAGRTLAGITREGGQHTQAAE